MKRWYMHGVIALLLVTLVILAPGCSSNKGVNPNQSVKNPNAADIDTFIAGLPNYSLNVPAQRPPKSTNPVYVVNNDAGWLLDYRFDVSDDNLVMTTNEIMSPNENFGVLWPGNVIQGKSISTGTLKPVPLDRAPMTLTISLDAPVTSVVVDTPNSVTAQQAVSDLERSVDPDLVGSHSPSNSGTVTFKVDAANSFQQSMLSMGITGGYSEPMSQQIGGSASMSVTRAFTEQTVVARLVQKLFTIRIADDLPALRDPAGFFAPSVTESDLAAQEAAGNIGPDNVPMYIESVTYGRIIVFTLKSTSAVSSDALAAAVNATYEGYTGGAGANSQQQQILATRTTEVYQAGGDASAAQAAVADLDFSKFFTDMQATQAVPISFKVKELKAGATGDFAKIFDSTTYESRDNGKRPAGYDVHVHLDKIIFASGVTPTGAVSGLVFSNYNGLPENVLGAWLFTGIPPQTHTFGSSAAQDLTYEEPPRDAINFPHFQTASGREGLTSFGHKYMYPFNEVTRGQTHTEKILDNGVLSDFEVYFSVSKTPYY